ncbi:hypothetical protein [Streptomyces olivaceoviridis]|uniref:hypothetical protein n=1 Tax=Streptomyces olivaceoviridis TaxID=1921 RepID=UPI0036F9AE6A
MTNLTEDLARVRAELAGVKRELAAFESLLCQCQPEREHGDYSRPVGYLHAADCIVAAAQQQAATE